MTSSVAGETRENRKQNSYVSKRSAVKSNLGAEKCRCTLYRVHVQPEVNVMSVMRFYPTDGRG
jgi:hypothetical protein